jgi:hypothetical protein
MEEKSTFGTVMILQAKTVESQCHCRKLSRSSWHSGTSEDLIIPFREMRRWRKRKKPKLRLKLRDFAYDMGELLDGQSCVIV